MLLGYELRRGTRVGRIVEVEAYEAEHDLASHAANGPTARNSAMFGPAGVLYVYLIYGMHLCCNVVCGPPGVGGAVLIRALEPVAGLDEMYQARPKARRDVDLCSGPGKLSAALGVVRSDNDSSLLDGPVRLEPATAAAMAAMAATGPTIVRGPRIGISKAVDRPWRFALDGNPHVSVPRPRAD